MRQQMRNPASEQHSGATPRKPNTALHAKIGNVLLAALLSGCAVGPDYQRPPLTLPQGYAAAPLPSATASAATSTGTAQQFVMQQDIQRDWWSLFRSPALNALIEQAFAASPTIEAAQAALLVAKENVSAQQGVYFPTIQAGYTPSRTKLAGNLGSNAPGIQGNGSVISATQANPVIYDFHTAQLTIGFVPDVFGANRRQVEALLAQGQAQQFQLEASYITLASNIVAAAIQDALLRQQIATTQEMIEADVIALEIAGRQLKAGYASRLDLALQEGTLAQARQLLAPLQKQLEQNRDLLRALSGTRADMPLPAFDLSQLQLPEKLPLSLPSRLVEQRPDVRAAEEQMHAASAQIGVARAARLPQFSISATAGGTASEFSQMFWNSGKFFDLSAGISQSIFDAGTLKHKEAAANQQLRGAVAQYRSTVITAIQNVADVLHAIYADAEALKAAQETAAAARTTRDLNRRQLAAGYLDRLTLINAEQNYRQTLVTLAQAQANRLADTAGLFQALGGGWWHRNSTDGEQSGNGPPPS